MSSCFSWLIDLSWFIVCVRHWFPGTVERCIAIDYFHGHPSIPQFSVTMSSRSSHDWLVCSRLSFAFGIGFREQERKRIAIDILPWPSTTSFLPMTMSNRFIWLCPSICSCDSYSSSFVICVQRFFFVNSEVEDSHWCISMAIPLFLSSRWRCWFAPTWLIWCSIDLYDGNHPDVASSACCDWKPYVYIAV